ncbi:MAG: N-acetyltransferase family protein [Pseudomonadota bacterium]
MIRAADARDAPWIAALWNGMIADTLFTFTTDLKTEASIIEMMDTRPVLALEGGLGFATYGPFRSGPGYAATVEHSILLDARAHGLGQGRALMAALSAQAHTAGYHIMIGAISAENPNAIGFHKAIGFEKVGQMPQVGRKAGRWLDLILMQKQLGPPG